MTSKPKAWAKQSKSKHKKEQRLDTADDYQAAGVDFEDAAGKWRAGDAVKSMRFFQRALETYEQGLQKFPQSLDLAYNKARVQLEIATHPILIKQLQQPVLAVLQTALDSHRYALELDPENADTLFNTSQALTGIAEEIAKNDSIPDVQALPFLEEALEMQNRCLALQELRYSESMEQQHEAAQQADDMGDQGHDDDVEDGGVSLAATQEQEEQWFSIVEPVTQDTLIDTSLAQLGTLTSLCGVLHNAPEAAQRMLTWIEEYSTKILSGQLPAYSRNHDSRHAEIALVKANFVSALLEAGFRAGRLDPSTYKSERDAAFATAELGLETSFEALLANARSLMAYVTALLDVMPGDFTRLASTCWNTLSATLTNLGTASKTTGVIPDDVAKTHLLRGDCSMLQRQMGLPPVGYSSAIQNASQLLKNAEVFYRNAGKLSSDVDERSIASFRSAVAQYIQNDDKAVFVSGNQASNPQFMDEQIEDMISEGLLPSGFQIR